MSTHLIFVCIRSFPSNGLASLIIFSLNGDVPKKKKKERERDVP